MNEIEEHVEECKMDWEAKQDNLKFEDRQLRPKEPDFFREALLRYIAVAMGEKPIKIQRKDRS
jgi:hypothetical protein